ncbi:hypothetical protein B7494_g8084 [Chlorociboria aeruginascens]|nr:hypothetical protein B7494_g8084 [Chlorociboria aeruginascens]
MASSPSTSSPTIPPHQDSLPNVKVNSTQPHCKVILSNTIAQALLAEVRSGLQALNVKPTLVGFLANDDPAAKMYAEWSEKTCIENGFNFDLRTVGKEEIEEAVAAANIDSNIHGIIVYYPIFPSHTQRDAQIQQAVAIHKDVEGLCYPYIRNMYQNIRYLDHPETNVKSILPCTPLAIVKVLEYLQIYNSILPYGNRLFGRTITVINRSEVVGRPLAALLANDGATVYSVDIDGVQVFTRGSGIRAHHHQVSDKEGWSVSDCLPLSDVVISGVPSKLYKIDTTLIKDGAVCVNFSSDKNFELEAVKAKASIYVPAVGKVTIAVLLRNLIRLIHDHRPFLEESYATASLADQTDLTDQSSVRTATEPVDNSDLISFASLASSNQQRIYAASPPASRDVLQRYFDANPLPFGFPRDDVFTQVARPTHLGPAVMHPHPLSSGPDFDTAIRGDGHRSISHFTYGYTEDRYANNRGFELDHEEDHREARCGLKKCIVM